MSKSSSIGKKHVIGVSDALNKILIGKSIDHYSDTVISTAKFIHNLYPNLQSVQNKFDRKNPDNEADLLLKLQDQSEIRIELFLIRGFATIQPKNLGAKSFLKKYFKSKALQLHFNDFFNVAHRDFLKEVVATKEEPELYDSIQILRNLTKQYYPKFTNQINQYRSLFLFDLREYCFELLKNEYNGGATSIEHAFNKLMLIDTVNIITRHKGRNKCLIVEQWKSNVDINKRMQIYKKGNDTVGIRLGREALTLRFKFESGPASSLKLATSYEIFPEETKVEQDNLESVLNFERKIEQHKQLESKNKSNAIGKCNEAMIYYRILKINPHVNQVNKNVFEEMLHTYSPRITHKELLDIKLASKITTDKIFAYFKNKYEQYKIESIQLVGNSYIEDRLDTSDLEVILQVDKKYMIESLSLKAISKRSSKITTKNPGIGTILGSQYFDIGSLSILVDQVKELYKKHKLTRQECLEIVSESLGNHLKQASQDKLMKGITSLLGNSIVVLTIYSENDSLVLNYEAIQGDITVHPKTPTVIQTTLHWNRNLEELSLRVKFSAGKSKGWSSLKLACDYRIRI